jgi:Ferritin-like domain
MKNKNESNDAGGSLNRRSFLTRASLIGGAVLLPRLVLAAGSEAPDNTRSDRVRLSRRDKKIIVAAEIAEALAVTTYMNIINTSPFFSGLSDNDQVYLTAALQEEMSHYAVLMSLTNEPSPYTAFYYPPNMFQDPQTTVNTLVTLEDAFIAAYLVGVRDFSDSNLRVTAARIMGIESDHRSLARVIAADLNLSTVTGAQGTAEPVNPANNNGYERTLSWTSIDQAVTALTPFVDVTAAGNAGFDTSVSYPFVPFTPTLPIDLGDFISFGG